MNRHYSVYLLSQKWTFAIDLRVCLWPFSLSILVIIIMETSSNWGMELEQRKSCDVLCASQFELQCDLTSADEELSKISSPGGVGCRDHRQGIGHWLVLPWGRTERAPQEACGNHFVAQTNSDMNFTS